MRNNISYSVDNIYLLTEYVIKRLFKIKEVIKGKIRSKKNIGDTIAYPIILFMPVQEVPLIK